MSALFLYFANEDKHWGRQVAQFLDRTMQRNIQWDTDANASGGLSRDVKKAGKSSAATIVLWSRSSANLSRCQSIANLAASQGKLITLKLDRTPVMKGVMDGLRSGNTVNYNDFPKLQMLLHRLTAGANGRRSRGGGLDPAAFFKDVLTFFKAGSSVGNDTFKTFKKLVEKLLWMILYRFRTEVLVGLLILTGGLIFKHQFTVAQIADNKAWEEAAKLNTTKAYQGYLSEHQRGAHVMSAEEAIESLAYKSDWEKAKKEDTLASYDEFLSSWPENKHVAPHGETQDFRELAKQAMREIDEKDDAAWMAALEEDDINGYQAYLMDRPEGRHRDKAGDIIDTMLENGLFGTIQRGDSDYTSLDWFGSSRALLFANLDATWGIVDIADQKLTWSVEGHDGPAFAATVIPSGSRIVTAGADGLVKLWSQGSNSPDHVFSGHAGSVYGISFSGMTAVSGGKDGKIRLWDLQQGRMIRVLAGHEAGVYAVAVSRDGRKIASGGEEGDVKIWDRFSGKLLQEIMAHTAAVNSVTFSADGKTVLSASSDKTLKITEVETGQIKVIMRGHLDKVNTAVFAGGGDWVLSGSSDTTLRLWDARSGASLRVMEGHIGDIYALAVSPDGRNAVSAGSDETIKLWTISPDANEKVADWSGIQPKKAIP